METSSVDIDKYIYREREREREGEGETNKSAESITHTAIGDISVKGELPDSVLDISKKCTAAGTPDTGLFTFN